jgi:hypothetical protein
MNKEISDSMLITFKAISNFTKELGGMFSNKQRSLKLYCRLIDKTKLSHDLPILKHIDAFREFCIKNRDAIVDESTLFNENKISYSERVYIDMSEIINLADSDDKPVIWKHLLYISALVDPTGKAKEALKSSMKTDNSSNKENKFLSDIIDKVESHVDPGANPMQAFSSIMKSGIFNDLISGMNNGLSGGDLDISKLMGSVTNMAGHMGNDPMSADMMKMMSTFMGCMGSMDGGMAGGGMAGGGMAGGGMSGDTDKGIDKGMDGIPQISTNSSQSSLNTEIPEIPESNEISVHEVNP